MDIIGATNEVDLQDLPLITYCSVLTSSTGVRVLAIFPHMVGYGKGKSILSKIQAETYDHQIYDKPHQCGGMKKIVTPDGFVFKLKYMKVLLNNSLRGCSIVARLVLTLELLSSSDPGLKP